MPGQLFLPEPSVKISEFFFKTLPANQAKPFDKWMAFKQLFSSNLHFTKHQQVIHNPLLRVKNALFDLWLSFFSFVHLMLTEAEIHGCFIQAKEIFIGKSNG